MNLIKYHTFQKNLGGDKKEAILHKCCQSDHLLNDINDGSYDG